MLAVVRRVLFDERLGLRTRCVVVVLVASRLPEDELDGLIALMASNFAAACLARDQLDEFQRGLLQIRRLIDRLESRSLPVAKRTVAEIEMKWGRGIPPPSWARG